MNGTMDGTTKESMFPLVIFVLAAIGIGMAVESGQISREQLSGFFSHVSDIWAFCVECIIAIFNEYITMIKCLLIFVVGTIQHAIN
jgi:hypothetical protein